MKIDKINNLLQLFYEQYIRQNKKSIFLQSLKEPKRKYSWEEVYINIIKLSEELSKYIKKGDRCLLISENRPEWMITDLSVMLAGGITVPAYTTYLSRDYEYIIKDCQPTLIIVSNDDQYIKVKNLLKKNKTIKQIFSFDALTKISKKSYVNINRLFNFGKSSSLHLSGLNNNRTDPACIIYTSGTQGDPKGVVLSHGGILSNCEGGYELLKPLITKNTKFLTWLPLSHSYEHTIQFIQIIAGAEIFYAESIDKLIKNMIDCSPHIMTAVPRFYQNLYQKINYSFKKARGVKKIFILQMLKLGAKKINKDKLTVSENFLNKILDYLVRAKIKKQFGGNIKAFISGGGALDNQVGIFLNAIGLPTLQGYGLTESSPIVSCNPISDIRPETAGVLFKTNDVKIAKDGEILVKGENVMLGYWNNKAETNKVIKGGWLYTGDVGEFVDGYLKITDRKKDILITPGGDNISPAKVENEIINSDLINQAVVYGDNKPYLSAILVLDNQKNISQVKLKKEIDRINNNLTNIEKIKKYILAKEIFSIENGLLTPSLKLKRHKIIEKYKKELESLY